MDNGELRLVKLARKGDREAFTQLVVEIGRAHV